MRGRSSNAYSGNRGALRCARRLRVSTCRGRPNSASKHDWHAEGKVLPASARPVRRDGREFEPVLQRQHCHDCRTCFGRELYWADRRALNSGRAVCFCRQCLREASIVVPTCSPASSSLSAPWWGGPATAAGGGQGGYLCPFVAARPN